MMTLLSGGAPLVIDNDVEIEPFSVIGDLVVAPLVLEEFDEVSQDTSKMLPPPFNTKFF